MLIKCSECGAEVSNQANKCPKCGAPTAQKKSGIAIIGAVIFFLLAAVCAYAQIVAFCIPVPENIDVTFADEISYPVLIAFLLFIFLGVACLKYRKK